MARLNFYLLEPKSKRETPIFFSLSYSGKRVKVKTKQKIHPNSWNSKSRSVRKNRTEYADVQIELNRIELVVKEEIRELTNKHNSLPQPKEFKKILESKIFAEDNENRDISFWKYFDNYIDELRYKKNIRTGKPITKSTREAYIQTYNIVKSFEDDTNNTIIFSNLSYKTYSDFVRYLEANLNFSPNTVGKHIKTLKSIINNAIMDGIAISDEYQSKKWIVTKQIKTADEIVFLNEEELNELWELDLSHNQILEKSRDIFIVGSWTALRFGDLIKLTIEDIDKDKGLIFFHTQKTDKRVAIPIHPFVIEVLKKYDGKMPKVSEPIVNKNIKIICEKIQSLHKIISIKEIRGNKQTLKNYKKFERVTTHTARRSFASNMLKRKLTKDEIMAITGHSKMADFNRYIGVTNEDFAKAINEKFKEWF